MRHHRNEGPGGDPRVCVVLVEDNELRDEPWVFVFSTEEQARRFEAGALEFLPDEDFDIFVIGDLPLIGADRFAANDLVQVDNALADLRGAYYPEVQ